MIKVFKKLRKYSASHLKQLKKKKHELVLTDPNLFKDCVESGLFDAEWYQNTTKLYFSTPEEAFEDYLRKSSYSNVAPSTGFDPISYFHNNPDVYSENFSPLKHYLRHGRYEGRVSYPLRDLWPAKECIDTSALDGRRTGRYAVVLHIYYEDFVARFYNAFIGVDFDFDLFVTSPFETVIAAVEDKFSQNPRVKAISTVKSPNKGRNFGPFLVEFSKQLKSYDYLCHMHSKKSLYSGSEQLHWAEYLLEYLARDKQVLRNTLNVFEANPEMGIYCPTTFWNMPQWTCHWLKNKGIGRNILKEWFGIEHNKDYFAYPAGGMFWARVDSIMPLLEREWAYSDFPDEPIPDDGTVLHVIERILPLIAENRGYKQFYYYPPVGAYTTDEGFIFSEYLQGLDFRMRMVCEQSNICSFDVFDTLVWRKYYTPDYAKYLLPEKAGLEISSYDFVTARNAAELFLRKAKGFKGDVSIVEVYDQLAKDGVLESSRVAELSDLEFEIDLSMIQPKEEMIEFLNSMANAGKEIYIITDTYYTRSQIDKLLSVVGVMTPYVLHVSSDTGLRKDNATVWKQLRKELKASGKSSGFVHIGDNVVSDSQLPGDFGFRSVHILAPKDKWQALGMPKLPDIEDLSDIKTMKKWGLLVARTGANPFLN